MSLNLTKKQLKELHDRFYARSQFIKKATLESIVRETDDQREARIKHLLKPGNYNEFFQYYFGKDTPIPMADCDCAWYHTAIYKDLYHNPYKTIFNMIFRGGAKSTHANMGYIFGLKQSDLAKFFLVVGAESVAAAILLQDLQVQFEQNRRILDDFGTQKEYGSWQDGFFQTTDRCTFLSRGFNQRFRGLRLEGVRVEYVSFDDLEDKKRAKNQKLVREDVGKITGDIQEAFSTRSERSIVNNNFFVKNGLIQKLALKNGFDLEKINTKQNNIIHNEFASLYQINLTDVYFDKIKEDSIFTPSWEERFPKHACIRKIRKLAQNKETLSGEHYNTPINVGKKFTEDMIKWVKPLPLEDYTVIVENWDMAYSAEGCYKAKATLGIKGINITVIDLFCQQSDISDILRNHYTCAKRILKKNSAFESWYDATASQEAVFAPEWLRGARKYKCFHIPSPQKSATDKYTKIETTLIGATRSGILSFSEKLKNNPDWEEAKAQCLNFEKGGDYPIDFPDSCSDAILKAGDYLDDIPMDEDEQNLLTNPIFNKRKRGAY